MYDAILVPTDGSDAATTAARSAVSLSRRFDADLHVIHVLDQGDRTRLFDERVVDELVRRGDRIVSAVEELAEDAGVRASTEVVEPNGTTHGAIVDFAVERDVDCIVVGTRGRTGLEKVALGSVAERTLRASPVPVITVHPERPLDPSIERILVPTDGSGGALAAADHAIELASATAAGLHVVHVVDPVAFGDDVGGATVLDTLEAAGQEAIDEIIDRATVACLEPIEATILSGVVARSIVDYAVELDVDCIVLGTHGRTGVDRLLLGSVTERVIRLADVPVIGVKAPEVIELLGSG